MSELVKVGGIQPFTLIDFPNRIAAVISSQACRSVEAGTAIIHHY